MFIICKEYKNYIKTDYERISQSLMYITLKQVKSCDGKILSSIDYVTSILINNTNETLQCIIDQCVVCEKRQFSSNLVTAAVKFLKDRYFHHIFIEDDI